MRNSALNRTESICPPQRFFSLDALRGLAALSVVVWHYQHFFYQAGVPASNLDRSVQPFYAFLFFFYERGYEAVQLFFVLSGFVFFWLYRSVIQNKEISAAKFFVLRFSRLYPLHFVTLILIVVLQYFYTSTHSGRFVYQFNDVYHFMLNLGFASEWGFQSGYSFNGPVWSVSLEIVLYIVFFIACRLGLTSLKGTAAITLAGLLLFTISDHSAGALLCFFLGGMVFHIYSLSARCGVESIKRHFTLSLALLTATILLYCAMLTAGEQGLSKAMRLVLIAGVFPLLVMSLVLAETIIKDLGKSMAFLGDLTYSVYLIHFPLQLGFVLIEDTTGRSFNYMDPWTFVFFMTTLIVISACSYHFLEKPAQSWIRRLYKTSGKTGPVKQVT